MSPFAIDLLLRIYSRAEPLADYSPMQMPLVEETLVQFVSRGWIAMVEGRKPKLRAEGNFIILRLMAIGAEPPPKLQVLEPQQEKTLRDYFAANAPEPIDFPRKSEWKPWVEEHAPDLNGNTRTVREGYVDEDGAKYLARWAYHYADAMLAAREAA